MTHTEAELLAAYVGVDCDMYDETGEDWKKLPYGGKPPLGSFIIREPVEDSPEEFDDVEFTVWQGDLGTYVLANVIDDVSNNSDYEFFRGIFPDIPTIEAVYRSGALTKES